MKSSSVSTSSATTSAKPVSKSTPPAPGPAAADIALQVATGHFISAALYAATRLGIADLLAGGPKPVSALASSCGAQEDALFRTLRALESAGIFAQTAPRVFALTPAAETLRSDVPGSVRDLVLFMSDRFHFLTYAEYFHSVKTGEPAVDKAFGKDVWQCFAADPQESAVFNNAMTVLSQMAVPAVLEAYDFSGIGTLVDVAGGHGFVLTSILAKYPAMRGVLFDLEHVIPGAKQRIASLGQQGRCTTVSGDFFKAVPPGDAYIMKHIIHDWDDDRAVQILANCRKGLSGPKGRVMLLEIVIPPGSAPHLGKVIDLEMLAMPGGKERTEKEYAELFARAGLKLTGVAPTKSPFSVIEAMPLV